MARLRTRDLLKGSLLLGTILSTPAYPQYQGLGYSGSGYTGLPVVNATKAPYNADPTGATDATAAINAALAAAGNTACVYLPTGTYYVTDALTPATHACVYGDGRALSVIQVYSGIGGKTNFNLAASGVFAPANNAGGYGPTISNLEVAFSQPDTGTRGSIVAFPPAFYLENTGRTFLSYINISGSNTCIDIQGTKGGHHFDHIECGALTNGILGGNPSDTNRISNFHFWNFGIGGLLYSGVYADGTNNCMTLAGNGYEMSDIGCFQGSLIVTAAAPTGGINIAISNLALDNVSPLQVAGGKVSIQGGYSSDQANQAVLVTGGAVELNNFHFTIANPANGNPLVQNNGGALSISNSIFSCLSTSKYCVESSAGTTVLSGDTFSSTGSYTVPFVHQSSTGSLAIGGGSVFLSQTSNVNTVPALQFATDVAGNTVGSVGLDGMYVSIPTTVTLGAYGTPFVNGTNLQIAPQGQMNIQSVATNANETVMGASAGKALANGSTGVTAIGQNAAATLTTGQGVTAIGHSTCAGMTTASNSTCVGNNAGSAGPGATSVALGSSSLQSATGANNTGIGYGAGSNITTGANNTLVGAGVSFGGTLVSGSRNILIGTNTNCDTSAAGTNDTFLLCASTASTPLLQGNLAAASLSLQVNGPLILPGPYSAAGTPLPSCSASINGAMAFVSDATSPTYNGTYTSGGAVVVPVMCVNGTGWKTH